MRRSLEISESSFCKELEHALKYVSQRNQSTRDANTFQVNRSKFTMGQRQEQAYNRERDGTAWSTPRTHIEKAQCP